MNNQPAHSPIGASSCERWFNCPGSVELSKTVPRDGGNKYTAEGTVAHLVAEHMLLAKTGNPVVDPSPIMTIDDEIGRSYVDDETDLEFEVTEEMGDAVQVYADTIQEYLTEYGLDPKSDLRVEVRFQLPHLDAQAYGTCDAVMVSYMNKIIVVDYKHGKGYAVEAVDNYQLMYYALGAYYGLPESDRADIATVEMVIVQPRARHAQGPVRKHCISVNDLLGFEHKLKEAISRVRSASPELQIGRWCKFCSARPICPAQHRAIEQETNINVSQAHKKILTLPDTSGLDADGLSLMLQNAELIREWANSVIGLASNIADKGIEIPGYKMVAKMGRRRWTNEKAIESMYALEFGDEIYNRKMKSPAQMEKLLKTKRKHELEPYIETPETGRTLVPADDPREPVNYNPGSAFGKFTGGI